MVFCYWFENLLLQLEFLHYDLRYCMFLWPKVLRKIYVLKCRLVNSMADCELFVWPDRPSVCWVSWELWTPTSTRSTSAWLTSHETPQPSASPSPSPARTQVGLRMLLQILLLGIAFGRNLSPRLRIWIAWTFYLYIAKLQKYQVFSAAAGKSLNLTVWVDPLETWGFLLWLVCGSDK